MARRSKIIFCLLLAFLYVVVNVCPFRAEAIPDVISGSSTIADIVMTYYAIGGSAVANPEWINTLYGSLGGTFGTIADFAENGMLLMNETGQWVASGGLEEAIANAPAYQSLGLDQVFNVSAEEVASGGGYAASTGAATLAGAAGAVGSTGVVPLLGGVTAAYWGGIGIGTMIAHMAGLYGEKVYYGLDVMTSDNFISKIPTGGLAFSIRDYMPAGSPAQYTFYVTDPGVIGYCFHYASDPTVFYRAFLNPTNGTLRYGKYNPSKNSVSWSNIGARNNSGTAPSYNSYTDGFVVRDYTNGDAALSKLLSDYDNGTLKNKNRFSPDMIGPAGNQTGEYSNDGYQIPNMLPQVDPGVQSGKPLSMEDWLNFANSVNNNNSQTNPLPDNQALFDNILDLIKQNIPNQNPDPGGDPYSPPVVTPVPDPSYPDPVPDQQITENPQESENPQQTENPIDTGKPWRLPDLRQKFPFCIPWDIAKIFSKLKVNVRQAPYISWRFNPPNTPIDYTFNLDLKDFEEVATLLRTLELMGFIVGLAFATRYLIGAN